MSRPVAQGSVLVHVPVDEVDSDFAGDVGELGEDGRTVIARAGPGRYTTEERAGMARVFGEFRLESAGEGETVVHATLWVRPSFFGVLARALLGRRRLQRGVDAALTRMARSATGGDQPPAEGFQSDAPAD